MQLDTLTVIAFITALLLTITGIATQYARVQDARIARAEKMSDGITERAMQERAEQFDKISQVLSAVVSSVSQIAATAQSESEILRELAAYVAEQRIRDKLLDRLRAEGQQVDDRRRGAPS